MSRIRSVWPGFFKDERLVPCSAFARLLFIGLGVEADDKGIFEWKPVTLKMNIFPADNVDVSALLEELVGAGSLMRFEVGGRPFGAIRNFRKYQKPKTPNDIHPMPDDVAEYVAFPRKGEMPADEPKPFPPEGEKVALMEDGGWKGKMEDKPPASVPDPARAVFDELWKVYPHHPSSSETEAEAAFNATKASERPALLAAALRLRQWFTEDNAERDRTEDAGARYVKPLESWISTGKWREADKLPLKSEAGKPDPDLAVVDAGSEDFQAIVKLRGKAPTVGQSGKLTVRKSELEQARAAA